MGGRGRQAESEAPRHLDRPRGQMTPWPGMPTKVAFSQVSSHTPASPLFTSYGSKDISLSSVERFGVGGSAQPDLG